jgi:putative hemolysin
MIKRIFAICLVVAGCSFTPEQIEEREYRHVEEVSMLREQWLYCLQHGGVLYTKNSSKRYDYGGGIHSIPAKSIQIWDARNTYCLND